MMKEKVRELLDTCDAAGCGRFVRKWLASNMAEFRVTKYEDKAPTFHMLETEETLAVQELLSSLYRNVKRTSGREEGRRWRSWSLWVFVGKKEVKK